MLTWELIGAVIGAGLASGMEIASFFSRYGQWGCAGICLSAGAMIYLADTDFPAGWHTCWLGKMWKLLLSLMLMITGGAMLSGAGEIAAMTIPISGAYWVGLMITLALAWMLAHRTKVGLAWISKCLLGVLAVLIALGYTLRPMRAMPLPAESLFPMPVRAIAYGGFNAALQVPVAALSGEPRKSKRRALLSAGCVIAMLLLLGHGVLLRHPALLAEKLPFVRMLTHFGLWGYATGALCLYLAVLSTLTACMRGLGQGVLPAAWIFIVSLMGFSGVVERLYPVLGSGCFLMLAAAKFMNYSRKAFISPRDML